MKDKTDKAAKSGSEQRRYARVEADLLVRFHDERGAFLEECVGNLSQGGIFVETLSARRVGDTLELRLRAAVLGSDEKSAAEVAVQGQVVHVADVTNPSDPDTHERAGMGIRFVYADAEQAASIKTFLDGVVGTPGAGSRTEARIYTQRHVTIVSPRFKGEASRRMPNVGLGGLFFETDREFGLFEGVSVRLEAGSGKPLELKGEVVHLRHTPDGKTIVGAGVRFVDLNDATRKALQHYLESLIEKDAP